MNPTLLIAVLTPLAAVVGATLGYLATRKRDTTSAEVETQRLRLEDAKAALEAWAEYATVVRADVTTSRDRIEGLELMIAELRSKLDDCLRRKPPRA
jgi:hypothetical protein